MTTKNSLQTADEPRTPLTPQEREIVRKAMIDAIRHCRKLGAEILATRADALPNDKAAA